MPAQVYVLPIWQTRFKKDKRTAIVSTISKAPTPWEWLFSPFTLGPVYLYKDYFAENVENGWQFSKVYKEHLKTEGMPCHDKLCPLDKSYWKWAKEGWSDTKAHRYPMGKGRKPEFSLWDGKRLDYIAARKKIYCPLYAKAVLKRASYMQLVELYYEKKYLVLLDYDAYDHRVEDMSLTDVLNNPKKKMGHAFVLAMLLTKDEACHEFFLNTLP